MDILKMYRFELCLFSIAVIWRLMIGGFILYKQEPLWRFPVGGDTKQYLELANNIKDYGVLYRENEAELRLRRPPGYPVFLAVFLWIFGNFLGLYIAALLQIFLAAFSVVLVYRLATLWISQRASFIAGALFALDPNSSYFSTQILADSLFVFFFISFLYVFLRKENNNTLVAVFFSGILLGLGTLVRPVTQFFPVIIGVYILLKDKITSASVKKILILFMGMGLIIFPWIIRNKIAVNSFDISSAGLSVHYHYSIPFFLSTIEHRSPDEIRQSLIQKLNTERETTGAPPTALMGKEITKVILQHPIAYTVFHIVKMTPFFLGDGIREILQKANVITEKQTDFSTLLARGEFNQIISSLVASPYTIILVTGISLWIIFNIAMIIGVLSVITKRRELLPVMILSLMSIFYFAILSGPSVTTRHRMPALFFVFFLAALGICEACLYLWPTTPVEQKNDTPPELLKS